MVSIPRLIRSCFFALILAPSALAQTVPLDVRWADLSSPDDGKATRALLALAATPKETTAFFKDHLKPVKANPERVAKFIKQLDSENFVVRSHATVELEYLGKYIRADLEAALKKDPMAETKNRIQQLLDKVPAEKKAEPKPMGPPKARPGSSVSVSNVNGVITILIDGQPLNLSPMAAPPPPPGPPLAWVRAVRAVTILEHLGTSDARQLLETMAAGESDALPTVAAREALARLKKE